MPSFEYDIGERERAGARFITDVKEMLQHAWSVEKSDRHVTYQSVADKLGVNRSVVNRTVMGLDNVTIRSVAELLWAIGWEPYFGVRKISCADGVNEGRELEERAITASVPASGSIGRITGITVHGLP